MTVRSFVPEIWAARLFTELQKAHVFGSVVNRDYEGEIRQAGDTVHINSLGTLTIGDYEPNVTVITPEMLSLEDQALVIDQAKYFAFYVDDVDARQAKGDLVESGTRQGAYQLRDVADQFLVGLAEAEAETEPTALGTGEEALEALVQAMAELDGRNVPTEGRFAVVSPSVRAKLVNQAAFLDASASGSTDPLTNGRVGRAMGFDIRISNNVSPDTVIAGHPMAITYAEQILKLEAYRPENSFSDAVKGLHVYGGKVVRPEGLIVLQA